MPASLLTKFKADRQRQLDVLPLAFANQFALNHLYRGFVEHAIRTRLDDNVFYLPIRRESEFGEHLPLNTIGGRFAVTWRSEAPHMRT